MVRPRTILDIVEKRKISVLPIDNQKLAVQLVPRTQELNKTITFWEEPSW